MMEAQTLNNASDKEIIDAVGSKLQDYLGCTSLDQDSIELLVASCQFGLLMEPKLLQQMKEKQELVRAGHIGEDKFPKEVQGKNWKMTIRKGTKSKPVA